MPKDSIRSIAFPISNGTIFVEPISLSKGPVSPFVESGVRILFQKKESVDAKEVLSVFDPSMVKGANPEKYDVNYSYIEYTELPEHPDR